jgi:hypothetical protein
MLAWSPSSIMPGKVNPVIAESLLMVCAQVVGNDATIAWCGAAGNFELNVMMPVLASDLLESQQLPATATRNFAERLVDGLEADGERIAALVEGSLATATALAPVIGYDKAAAIVKEANRSRRFTLARRSVEPDARSGSAVRGLKKKNTGRNACATGTTAHRGSLSIQPPPSRARMPSYMQVVTAIPASGLHWDYPPALR